MLIKYKRLSFIILLCLSVFACMPSLGTSDKNIIFVENGFEQTLVIASHFISDINLDNLTKKSDMCSIKNYFYDSAKNNIKCVLSTSDMKTFFIYDYKNGAFEFIRKVELARSVCIYGINDNMILCGIGFRQYQVINIDDNNIVGVNLLQNLNVDNPTGFCDDKIFFDQGYYDLLNNEYFSYNFDLDNIRPSKNGKKIVGINEAKNIVIYTLETNQAEVLPIKIKLSKHIFDSSHSLYWLDDDKLYFSEDANNSFNKWFLKYEYTPKNWYVYDLHTKTIKQIGTTTKPCLVIGYIRDDM